MLTQQTSHCAVASDKSEHNSHIQQIMQTKYMINQKWKLYWKIERFTCSQRSLNPREGSTSSYVSPTNEDNGLSFHKSKRQFILAEVNFCFEKQTTRISLNTKLIFWYWLFGKCMRMVFQGEESPAKKKWTRFLRNLSWVWA
jgi:hypothetical protein